jgi:hypothetical protein
MTNPTVPTLKQNIKALLVKEPQCAKSYTLLVIRYWMKIEGATDFQDALGCTSPEAITRAFRDLVSTGEIAVPQDIADQRKKQEAEYRKVYGGKPLAGFMDLSGNDL